MLPSAALAQLTELKGQYVTVKTDLPVTPAMEDFTKAFDLAVPQWCAYFQRDIGSLADWHVKGYLMVSREAFKQRGVLPATIPPFAHGYQSGETVWVINQPSDYYTRHLLLHEGVHALMYKLFGGAGPPWFMEGTAELLATHAWDPGKVQVGVIPSSRAEYPYWGRLKVISKDRSERRALTLSTILNYGPTAHLAVEPYAWSWAALVLLDQYPEYRNLVVQQAALGRESVNPFNRSFRQKMGNQWPLLQMRWQMLIEELDYGYDTSRNRIELGDVAAWQGQSKSFSVDAARGWQSTGIQLTAGQTIALSASGRYQIGNDPKPWICEPGGVTIEYYRGRPIGMLLAAIATADPGASQYLTAPQIVGVGSGKTITAATGGVLLLRVGDDPGKLDDNRGSVNVEISQPPK